MTHDRQVEELKREVEQLQRLVETHRAEALMAQERWRNVQLRVRQLGDDQLHSLRARLQEARQKLDMLERDTAHRLRLVHRRVEDLARVLTLGEGELRALYGR